MGSDDGPIDEKPLHPVSVKTFEMDRTEVTVAAYQRCVAAGACTEAKPELSPEVLAHCNAGRPERQNHPINCVTWQQARDYCAWAGKRLPSEEQWEFAARNRGDGSRYPWGDARATCSWAVMRNGKTLGCERPGTHQVCSRPAGKSAEGLCDMAGNVWEWTTALYCPYDDKKCRATDRVVRGGSWNNGSYNLRAANRCPWHPGNPYITVGLRCVR